MNRINSRDELASFVTTRRQNLGEGYKRLATEMAQFGESKLEAIYSLLAGDAVQPDVPETPAENRTPGNGDAYVPLPANAELPDVASLSTPYAIWAYAVSNEIHLFEELTAANISIDSSDLQSDLAVEARACLDRADGYRAQRRQAFHAERLSDEIAQFPDLRRIDTQEDFAHVALAIEHYFQGLLSSYDGSSGGLDAVIEATAGAVSYLEPVARDAGISKRLTRPLKRLATATSSQAGKKSGATNGIARIAIEADRIFDYYDQVFESTLDPEIISASQYLSANILGRLRTLRETTDAPVRSGQSAS